MSTPTRYDLKHDSDANSSEMVESRYGDYVMHSDYEDLEREKAKLQDAIDAAKDALDI